MTDFRSLRGLTVEDRVAVGQDGHTSNAGIQGIGAKFVKGSMEILMKRLELISILVMSTHTPVWKGPTMFWMVLTAVYWP